MQALFVLIIANFLWALHPTSSHAIELGMPIKCEYGNECFIQNYFDADPTQNARDYHLGHLSYNDHDGTDFRIRDYIAMQQGVDVIATADGIVKAIRDDMEDINVNKVGKAAVMKQGCGNAVVLLHPDDYSTFYCHMKKGSVAVKKGDHIKKGQKLGEVGLSGLTEFPHVHLGVLHHGQKIDPFTGLGRLNNANTSPERHILWDAETSKKLAYIPTGLLNSAFSTTAPEPEAARAGKFTLQTTTADTQNIIFWVDLFGMQPNDKISLDILTPEGETLTNKHLVIDRYKAALFYYISVRQKNPYSNWKKGTYSGRVMLTRNNTAIIDEIRTLLVN